MGLPPHFNPCISSAILQSSHSPPCVVSTLPLVDEYLRLGLGLSPSSITPPDGRIRTIQTLAEHLSSRSWQSASAAGRQELLPDRSVRWRHSLRVRVECSYSGGQLQCLRGLSSITPPDGRIRTIQTLAEHSSSRSRQSAAVQAGRSSCSGLICIP